LFEHKIKFVEMEFVKIFSVVMGFHKSGKARSINSGEVTGNYLNSEEVT
jgi:hypothetical protein